MPRSGTIPASPIGSTLIPAYGGQLQVPVAIPYLLCLSLGLNKVSREKPIMTNARDTSAIERPGGSTHHQILCAPWSSTRLSILPQDRTVTSPSPRKLSAASLKIAPG